MLMVKLKCPNKKCGYEWGWKGKKKGKDGRKKFFTSCPRCLYKVNIEKDRI